MIRSGLILLCILLGHSVQAQQNRALKNYGVELFSHFVQEKFDWISNQSIAKEDRLVLREQLQKCYDLGLEQGLNWKGLFIDNVKVQENESEFKILVLFMHVNKPHAWHIILDKKTGIPTYAPSKKGTSFGLWNNEQLE